MWQLTENRARCQTIDVQGYELEVLKGSRETITNISGILTEVNRDELYSNCDRVEQLDDFLKNFDFYLGSLGFKY